MPIARRRQRVDQVDEAVLQAAGGEVVDDVEDEGRRRRIHLLGSTKWVMHSRPRRPRAGGDPVTFEKKGRPRKDAGFRACAGTTINTRVVPAKAGTR